MFRRGLVTFLMGGLGLLTVFVLTLTWIGGHEVVYFEIPLRERQFGMAVDGKRIGLIHWRDHTIEPRVPDWLSGADSVFRDVPDDRNDKWKAFLGGDWFYPAKSWEYQYVVDVRHYSVNSFFHHARGDGNPVPLSRWVLSDEPDNFYYWRVRRSIVTPAWFAALVFGGPVLGWLALISFRAVRRRRLLKRGRCITCGYQLLDENQYCPECGSYRERFVQPRNMKAIDSDDPA